MNTNNEDILTLKDIIKDKPATKVVREFMRFNAETIVDEEEGLFDEHL